ncbi:MAG TPA: amidinotransferase [Actinomycetota bacterium]|nr:amidinotransferase [Actinomycetota bacterium]
MRTADEVAAHDDTPDAGSTPVVGSYNEWDPLEEVVVGVIEGAVIPPWHDAFKATLPEERWEFFERHAGEPFPQREIEAASAELDGFVRILEDAGVTVRRPAIVDHGRPFSTPDWTSEAGMNAAMARDFILVVGDQIIEAPMAWRAHYFTAHPFRPILLDYWRRGARWVATPRPELADASYNPDYDAARVTAFEGPEDSVITEYEPLWEAGDFMRCGRDVFVQRSNVTNASGIEWVRRHLGDDYRVHEVAFDDERPMHVNATFLPLAPGKVLVNPERVKQVPEMFAGWDVLVAPEPCMRPGETTYTTSRWINLNVLMLDPEHVFVEASEEPLLRAFESWGFEPVPVPFRAFNLFGGAFHCATADIRRRGGLEDYFS